VAGVGEGPWVEIHSARAAPGQVADAAKSGAIIERLKCDDGVTPGANVGKKRVSNALMQDRGPRTGGAR